MHNRKQYERLLGIAAAGIVVQVGSAAAQDVPAPPPVVAPTPTPARSPSIIYLPGAGPSTFTTGPRATPTPTPVPSPVVARTPAPRATPRATSTSAPAARPPAPEPAPSAAPAQTEPSPTPVAAQPTAPPVPAATATPVLAEPQPARQSESLPGWLWALIGAGAALAATGSFLALRSRRAETAEAEEALPEPLPTPPPAPAAPPVPVPAPRPAPARASEPFEIALRPAGITLGEREVVLEFELLIGNLQDVAAENIRPQIALISAHPDQDRELAGFHAAPVLAGANQAFDLPAGGGGRMPVRLGLQRDRIHVVQVGGRPMFVPIVMIDLRWRSGISIRRFGADFMVGTAGQAGKVGPIWLDRPSVTGPLAATRYRMREVAAA